MRFNNPFRLMGSIHIIDTAGLRETEDIVEKRNLNEPTQQWIKRLVLLLIDTQNGLSEADQNLLIKITMTNLAVIIVFNKIDLLNQSAKIEDKNGHSTIYLSAKTGVGIEILSEKIRISRLACP